MARIPVESFFLSDQTPPVIVSADDEEDAGYRELIESLKREPVPWTALLEAIRCSDEAAVREQSQQFEGVQTLSAKREAVLLGKPDFLKILLEGDDYIDEGLVATACERKDCNSVRLLLEFGWPIDKPVHFTASLLCIAVDDAGFTRWLVEMGADVNARNALDESALSVAIVCGSVDVVHLLIAHGTDLRHGDLLHCAAQRKDQTEGAELVEELVEKGADVNAYRHCNPVASRWRIMSTLLTPLHVACNEGNIPVTKALLGHGADPCRKSLNAGIPTPPTPLDMALQKEDRDLIDLLRTYDRRDRASL